MSPVSSARSMNSAAASRPRSGWCQRTSASTATMATRRHLHLGLVVDHQLAVCRAAWRSSISFWSRRGTLARRVSSNTSMRSRPNSLAAYMAAVGVAQQVIGALGRLAS